MRKKIKLLKQFFLKNKNSLLSRAFIALFCVLLPSGFFISASGGGSLFPSQGLPDVTVGDSGAAIITVKIEVPPATAGMGPDLNLIYSSSAGNGMMGPGWNLSGLATIARDSSRGINYSGADRYSSSLGGELVLVSPGLYKNKYDGNIFYYPAGACGDGPCSWTAILPDGKKYFFGATLDSVLNGPSPHLSSVRTWELNRVEDSHGDYWTVAYWKDGGFLYPQRIEYTQNSSLSLTIRSVDFEYEDRPDISTGFSGGVRGTQTQRLNSIVIEYNGSETRRYDLEYTESPLTLMSFLARVREFVAGNEIRAPLSFSYSNEDIGYSARSTNTADMGLGPVDQNFCNLGEAACGECGLHPINTIACTACIAYHAAGGPARCAVGNTWNVGDINGDGKLDFTRNIGLFGLISNFINADSVLATFLNENSPVGSTGTADTGQPFGDPGTQTYVDVNGDSRADYVRKSLGTPLVSLSNGSGFFTYGTWTLTNGVGNNTFSQWIDVNSDGKADYARLLDANNLSVALSNGAVFSSDVQTTGVDSGVTGADAFRQMADFDGDGYVDFCEILSGDVGDTIRVFKGNGDGSFTLLGDFDVVKRGHQDFRALADVNSDGFADFIRQDATIQDVMRVSLGTGRAFAPPISNQITNIGDKRRRQLADVNGDGMLDLVRFINTGTGYQARVNLFRKDFFYGSTDGGGETDEFDLPGLWDENAMNSQLLAMADTNGDGRADLVGPGLASTIAVVSLAPSRPGLLTQITNGDGKTQTITYAPLPNSSGTNPAVSQNFGGFSVIANSSPQFVVQSVRISGRGGPKAETAYQYSDSRIKIGPGRDDARGLGFSQITIRPYVFSGGPAIPGATYTVKYFWQNHPTLGYEGAGILRQLDVLKTSDNSVVSQTIPVYGRPAGYAHPQLIKIAELSSQTTDYSTTPAISTRQSFTAFDSFGTPTRSFNERDLANPGDDSTTEVTLSYPASNPAGRADSQSINGNGQSYSAFAYDSSGNMTGLSQGLSESSLVTTTLQYNAAGNLTGRTVNGQTVSIEYDSEIAQFPVKVTVGGIFTQMGYDLKRGLKLWEKDPSGTYNVQSYDDYERPTVTSRGPSSIAFVNTTLQEVNYTPQPGGGLVISKSVAFDGDSMRAENTALNEWGLETYNEGQGAIGMIRQDSSYDAHMRKISETLPYPSGGATGGVVSYQNDFLGRVTRVDMPGPSGTITILSDPQNIETASFGSEGGVTHRGYAIAENRPGGQTIYTYKTLDDKVIQTEYQTTFATASSPTTRQNGWTRIRYHYNSFGQIVAISRGTGVTRTGISDNPALTSRINYDSYGRKTGVFDPDKGVTTFAYNAAGQPECTAPPDGATTCKTHDANGRVTTLRNASVAGTVIAAYVYDEGESAFGAGRLTSIQDESGHRRIHYDNVSGKIERIERTYTANGKIKKFDIVHTYAPNGMLVSRAYPAVNLRIIYDYYPEGIVKNIKLYDPDGHIVSDGNGAVLAQYQPPNALGKVPGVVYGNGVSIAYDYGSAAGNLTRMRAESVVSGQIADYNYTVGDTGLLLNVTDNTQTGGVDLSESFQYDPASRLIAATGPYGDATSPQKSLNYTYGVDGQPRQFGDRMLSYNAANPHRLNTASDLSYTYDVSGGPGRGNVALRSRAGGETKNFTYAYNNRLRSVHTYDANGASDTTFLYDVDGNRFEKRFDANGIDITTHYLSPEYQIRSDGGQEIHTLLVSKIDGPLATFGFNAIYELAEAPASSIYYRDRILAGLGRLPEILGNGGISRIGGIFGMIGEGMYGAVAYDENIYQKLYYISFTVTSLFALSLILFLWKKHDSRDRKNHTSLLFPVPFLRGVSLAMVVIFYGTFGCIGTELPPGAIPVDGTISPDVDGLLGHHYYITNQVQSNHLVTDATGKLVCRYVYKPFGELNMALTNADTDGDGVPFLALQKFTGQEYDYETGLYNYNARTYDQEAGRFLQPDAVHSEHAGMDNYDRYQYAHNNPVNFTDPTGNTTAFGEMGPGTTVPAGTIPGVPIPLPMKVFDWRNFDWRNVVSDPITGGMKWAGTSMGNAAKWAGTSMGNTLHEMATGGTYSRHDNYDGLDALKDAAEGTAVFLSFVNPAFMAAALGTAAGIVLVATIWTVAAAAVIIAIILAPILWFNAFGAIGYVAGALYGGLHKSSLNHIHWDGKAADEFAKKGFVAGTVVQVVAAAIITGCTFAAEVCAYIMENVLFAIADAVHSGYLIASATLFALPIIGAVSMISIGYEAYRWNKQKRGDAKTQQYHNRIESNLLAVILCQQAGHGYCPGY